MSPLAFEEKFSPLWAELEALLDAAEGVTPVVMPTTTKNDTADKPTAKPRRTSRKRSLGQDGERLTRLYRQACEHLALAQARAYPVHLTQRLEQQTQRAHRLVYRRHDYGWARLRQLVLVDFPQAVRAHRAYVLAATLLFGLPLLLAGWAAWRDPGFLLHFMDAASVHNFDRMYGPGSDPLGHRNSADSNWQMFGMYIMNNIGIGFKCFAAGLFFGLGSIAVLLYNGLAIGGVGGYMVRAGYTENFYSFVITHGAFELTAIVLSGAAGLRLGHALLAPGRHTRLQALQLAARGAIVVVYGVVGLLLVAAAIEAFWSSARWVAPAVKYGVGAACWSLVLAYLGWQGRPSSASTAAGGRHAD
jgi:uncharacterized membrane protein SpoIIM required for sporulation